MWTQRLSRHAQHHWVMFMHRLLEARRTGRRRRNVLSLFVDVFVCSVAAPRGGVAAGARCALAVKLWCVLRPVYSDATQLVELSCECNVLKRLNRYDANWHKWSSSYFIRGRQQLNCLALRLPIGPNALPLINQKPNDKGEGQILLKRAKDRQKALSLHEGIINNNSFTLELVIN